MLYDPSTEKQQELLNTINYDDNVNQINNKTWDDLTLGEKTSLYYEDAGGTKQIISSGAYSALANGTIEAVNLGIDLKNNIKDNITNREQPSNTSGIRATILKPARKLKDTRVVSKTLNILDKARSNSSKNMIDLTINSAYDAEKTKISDEFDTIDS